MLAGQNLRSRALADESIVTDCALVSQNKDCAPECRKWCTTPPASVGVFREYQKFKIFGTMTYSSLRQVKNRLAGRTITTLEHPLSAPPYLKFLGKIAVNTHTYYQPFYLCPCFQ
jgi:hypothetical protein